MPAAVANNLSVDIITDKSLLPSFLSHSRYRRKNAELEFQPFQYVELYFQLAGLYVDLFEKLGRFTKILLSTQTDLSHMLI